MSQTLPTAVNARDWQEGPADAPVTLLEYGDFQCGDCREAHHVLKPLRVRYADKIRFVYRHLPLTDIHPHALDAARASEAAGLRSQFWAMHDALMEGLPALTSEELQQAAVQLGLDANEFATNLQSEETYNAVRADVDGIRASGVRSTPTLFLNGLLYEGAIATTALTAAIEAALSQTTS